jgi:hypothetical protein
MSQIISCVLVVLWFLYWTYGVRSVHIHVLLVLAVTLLIAHRAVLLTKRKPQFTRAQRVPVLTRIRYCRVGDAEWFTGMTENISQTGVLFQAEHIFRLNTPVQMTLEVPQPILGLTGSINCEGCIVRTTVTIFGDTAHLAAKILAGRSIGPNSRN